MDLQVHPVTDGFYQINLSCGSEASQFINFVRLLIH